MYDEVFSTTILKTNTYTFKNMCKAMIKKNTVNI